ncbi:MAG: hypothetical protein A2711_14790 [Burkholderiales bacterium RIFCSPHIGHO2_01_FULL_63_240]|jgi:Tfp pilus assembly protein PilX|nr:MAG: hypothetical protein A2711_14790 [Burkholderiales bacterium RIFCSPHIGHO2_01_FULL_63_240]
MNRPILQRQPSARQRGLSLIFALLALMVLSLGAVALVRSVDSGTLVLGNLGFKQEATTSADRGTQAAIDWLSANSASLDANNTAGGYYATAYDNLDATGQLSSHAGRVLIDWNGDTCAYASGTAGSACSLAARTVVTAGDNEPVTLRYTIFRLCTQAAAPSATGNSCAKPASANMGPAADKGSLDYTKPAPLTTTGSGNLYRILVQAVGARNTASITETIVQF